MVNGRMCCGVLKTDLVLRLTAEEGDAALREPYTRPMIYVSAIGAGSDKALAARVESALKFARSAPRRSSRQAPRGVALLLQVWALADQRSQNQRPRERHGSGIEAFLVVTGLVIERAGQRQVLFSTQRRLRFLRAL